MKQIANKKLKTKALKKDPEMARHLPDQRKYSRANIRDMLRKYDRVVAKPQSGTGGVGLIQIVKKKSYYKVHYKSKKSRFTSKRHMLNFVDSIRKRKAYILQRGIKLVKIQGRSVDYRVKLAAVKRRWRIRAIVARVAKKGLFVTNLCKGGDLLKSKKALKRSFSEEMAGKKRAEMRGLAFKGAKLMEKRFPGIKQLGFDFGIDKEGKVWIFEVNTRPQ